MCSSSSTESTSLVPPGTEISSFRIERVLGRGRAAVVYEATQLDLDRKVALKLLPADPTLAERLRDLRWPEHPNVVTLYAAGVTERGSFLAMQLVAGATLAELRTSGRLEPAAARKVLDDVAAALDAAHRSGSVHGAIRAQNILVDDDGRGLVSDFGLGDREPARSGDLASFTALVSEVLGVDAPEPLPATAVEILQAASPPARRSRRRWLITAAAIALFAGAGWVVLAVTSSDTRPERPPPLAPGLVALGSALTAVQVDSVDCRGRPPSGVSGACTVVQTRLGDRLLGPRRSGVVRRWTVRGAVGDLALQVLRRRGKQFFLVARTQYVHVTDRRLHVETANLPIRPGDLVGLEVTPGAAIGVDREGGDAETARWFGPIVYSARAIEQPAGSGFDRELLLRVEYEPGARWRPVGAMTGGAAATATAGRVIARVAEPGSSIELVRANGGIAVDLVLGRRRVTRLPVLNADPRGQLVSFDEGRIRFSRRIIRLRWQNATTFVTHDYIVAGASLTPLSS